VPLTAQLLDKLLGPIGSSLQLVVLNACDSAGFARELL